jgi:hypothetical protein
MAYLDAREAAEKIFSAQLELATKRGTITEDQTMEKEFQLNKSRRPGLAWFGFQGFVAGRLSSGVSRQ